MFPCLGHIWGISAKTEPFYSKNTRKYPVFSDSFWVRVPDRPPELRIYTKNLHKCVFNVKNTPRLTRGILYIKRQPLLAVARDSDALPNFSTTYSGWQVLTPSRGVEQPTSSLVVMT